MSPSTDPSRRFAARCSGALVAMLVAVAAGCGGPAASTAGPAATQSASVPATPPATVAVPTPPESTLALPAARTLIIDTDVAPDDLIAMAFLLRAPTVTVVGITVSGTGEAHCAGGVNVVLGLLEALAAPEIPVACGRETPLAGDHAFPDAWRDGADRGSGVELPPTSRVAASTTAVELITSLSLASEKVAVLTLGPLTNLAEALQSDPGLAGRLGPVVVMGGAVRVAGNLLVPGGPTGNTVAEWNVYVDPRAAAIVVDSGIHPSFISLDGTNQVPVTVEFARRAIDTATQPAGRVLAQLLQANPFMASGGYFLWDPLAAEVAAGYEIGSLESVAIRVEEAEGPESGFTRPIDGDANSEYLATADAAVAVETLLSILNRP